MSETAKALVAQMVAAGEWPEPQLMEAILATGQEAVQPLIEVLAMDVHGWPDEAPVDHAVGLLSELKAPAAIPALLGLFRRYEHELLEGLPQALVPFGMQVFEPLLEIVRDTKPHWYVGAVAGGIAQEVCQDTPEALARLQATRRELLAGFLARVSTLDENEVSIVSSLVVDLAHLADPEAHGLVDRAVAAGLSEMMAKEDVEDAYREGPRRSKPTESDWLQSYRRYYQEHLERDRRRQSPPPPAPIPVPTKPVPRVLPSITRAPAPRPAKQPRGRNEPCWCGSGKKYKKCHMLTDQQ
jgi:hypothetical protein